MSGAYREDLSYIHHLGFGHLAKNAAEVLLNALQHGGIDRGLVIDLCCGSGLLARDLTVAGYEVLGIDISEALLSIAKEHAPSAHFRQELIWESELPSCVAVTAIEECFNYLFDDEGNTDQALYELLGRIHTALDPGGLLLFDVAEPGRVPDSSGLQRTHTEGEDWTVLMSAQEEHENRLLTRRITTFRKAGELYRRDEEIHRLRLVARSELLETLGDLGFEVEILESYGQLQLPPGLTGFLAHKVLQA
jgi:SAM-dependent methyltransferase